MTRHEADRRFAELARDTFGESVTPLVLEALRAGNHEHAQELLDAADRKERALREAPRETCP